MNDWLHVSSLSQKGISGLVWWGSWGIQNVVKAVPSKTYLMAILCDSGYSAWHPNPHLDVELKFLCRHHACCTITGWNLNGNSCLVKFDSLKCAGCDMLCLLVPTVQTSHMCLSASLEECTCGCFVRSFAFAMTFVCANPCVLQSAKLVYAGPVEGMHPWPHFVVPTAAPCSGSANH